LGESVRLGCTEDAGNLGTRSVSLLNRGRAMSFGALRGTLDTLVCAFRR
jgi:hypothetical protein